MNIFNEVAKESKLAQLIGSAKSNHVGYVYSMNFSEAFVLTNDAWKESVAGIPHNSFLIASGFDPDRLSEAHELDREIVLLRVLGPASLPSDVDLLKTRIEHNQRRTSDEIFTQDVHDGLDPLTQAELQYGALKCRILGTFYTNNGELRLGSDIENYMSSTRLRVFKPRGDSLAMIVNHMNAEMVAKALEEASKSGFSGMPSPIEIGKIRYTSSDRLHRGPNEPLVPVNIQPTDFLARRTAILGMTRTGKSNTLKTTVSAVAIAALKDKNQVGQIIYDINGEYANANHQDDGSSIADVFAEDVVCYRGIKTADPKFRDLRNNFYEKPHIGLAIIQSLLKEEQLANDMKILASSLTLDPLPEDATESEKNRHERNIAAFQALLYVRGFAAPKGLRVKLSVSKAVKRQVLENAFPDVVSDLEMELGKKPNQTELEDKAVEYFPDYSSGVTLNELADFFKYAREADKAIVKDYDEASSIYKKGGAKIPSGLWRSLRSGKSKDDWLDDNLKAICNLIIGKSESGTPIRVKSLLGPIANYHSPNRQGEVESEIYQLLLDGKIVILDLSVGTEEVRKSMAVRIAHYILEHSMATFHRGANNTNIVMYVEEAHNLIGRKDDLSSTWPRIAKEGAKAKIAFVYATQEPSSIHPNILANTENWFVTHLNNEDELRALGKFYDFADFHASLKTAQDVGFARIKTLSSPFVIPTQINRFTPDDLKAELIKFGSLGGNYAL
jgi:hypothetical protein